jgi:hypothetical protein
MTLRLTLRGFRAPAAVLLSVSLLLAPAAADAAAKKRPAAAKSPVALHEAHGKKPAAENGLGNRAGLGAAMQLAAMTTAIRASPSYWTGLSSGCNVVTPLLASEAGNIMAGSFRDSDGNCYVWMNLQQSALLTGSEICKTTLHEMGHLNGLQHSANPVDVMFSPFVSDPIPGICLQRAKP